MYESALGRVAIRFSREFGHHLSMVRSGAELTVLFAGEAHDAVRAGEAALDEWHSTLRETYVPIKKDMDAAHESFRAAFGAIRFIEEAYRTPGAHVATYRPMEVIPLRAAVLAALADAGSTAPSMPAEWADEVLVRASPDALHAVLSRWLARCLRVHREVLLSFQEDADGAHLTLHAPDAREVFALEQRIERPMLMALARAAGALEPPAAPSPDTLMVITFARA